MSQKTSNAIQTCPGCDSFILSDTYECPECGHVFDEGKAAAAKAAKDARESEQQKFNALHDPCPKCGEMVRTGLVRCWKCNSFMRKDVADKYHKLTSNPQQIIFSDIPADQRTEFIPARMQNRHGAGYGRDIFDAEDDQELSGDDEFTLQDGGEEFELDADLRQQSASRTAGSPPPAKPTVPTDGPDQPKQQTPGGKDAAPDGAAAKDKSDDAPKAPPGADADELLGIAMKEQRETAQRRRERLAQAKRKRILIPCACGAWVRVTEEQSGRTVRCRQCKKPMLVPEIKKKDKPAARKKKEVAPEISVEWVDNVHLHVLNPTDLVLKPGSLEKEFEPVDVGFHESGLQLIKFGAAGKGKGKKKSLFGRGGGDDQETTTQRNQVREHITKTGGFSGLPHGELMTVEADKTNLVRMVQPVAAAHESMFAGVPVFGDGRIAVYLPLDPGENRQAFLSFSISAFRGFAAHLKTTLSVELPADENGVPSKEETEALSCFVSQSRVESLKNLAYYQNDPAFELELSGYKCAACGIALSEESRAKKKLGGAAGKSIAKAKCPKCSSKFGNLPLYRIAKAPEKPDGAAERPEPASAESPTSDAPAESTTASDTATADVTPEPAAGETATS